MAARRTPEVYPHPKTGYMPQGWTKTPRTRYGGNAAANQARKARGSHHFRKSQNPYEGPAAFRRTFGS